MSDQLVRAISKDGFVKAVAVSTRDLTERARQIHHTTPVVTAAMGVLPSRLTIKVSMSPSEKVMRFCRAMGPVNRKSRA